MGDFIKNNPALFYSFTIGLTAAVISVIVAFGVPVTPEIANAVSGLITIVASIIIGVVTRGKVVPFQNVLEYREINQDGTLSQNVVAGPANEMVPTGTDVRAINKDTQSEPNFERF